MNELNEQRDRIQRDIEKLKESKKYKLSYDDLIGVCSLISIFKQVCSCVSFVEGNMDDYNRLETKIKEMLY